MDWGHTDRHYMAKANCQIIADYAAWLANEIQPSDALADWMEYYLSVARTYVSDAYHAWKGMADEYRARINPKAESYMAIKNIRDLADYGKELYDLIEDNEPLPDWMEHKLAVARRYVGDVKHAVEDQIRSQNVAARRNPDYTDEELIQFLSDGKEISAWELKYSFGGSTTSHSNRLKKLVDQGILQLMRKGKYGNIYALADNVK